MEKICCFTGHRPQSLPWKFCEKDPRCQDLKKRLRREIIHAIQEENIHRFLTGMALGWDTWAAEAVLQLQKQYMVTLEGILPCRGQDAFWCEKDRQRYRAILERCNKVTLLQESYTKNCFDPRNHYMVRKSDLVIALWNGSPSGTGSTLSYARKYGKTIWILSP